MSTVGRAVHAVRGRRAGPALRNFGSTSKTVSHDHAGNLIDDGDFRYVYDAWNRLVNVQAGEAGGAVTVQTSEFDGVGRRIKKTVTSSGDLDGTVVYLYDGQKIIETRDGSGNLYQQVIHGTQYIDEIVMVRVADKGDLYIHQDANWNVIGATDLGGSVVERYVLTPYGSLTANQETGFGDRDGDGDVDATDKGTPGTDCTGTVTGACRILDLDLDFHGDYDSADATLFDALPQGLGTHPGRESSSLDQPFAHQGLLFEPEIASYHNRARQYDPYKRRFVQRDRLWRLGTLDRYGYIRQNSLTSRDPSGMIVQSGNSLGCAGLALMLKGSLGGTVYECCGRQLQRKSGVTVQNCTVCEILDRMISDPTHTYNMSNGTGPSDQEICNSGYCNLPGSGTRRDIYIDKDRLSKLPKEPPDPPKKHGTTRSEMVAHELREAECIANGGSPTDCHNGAATDA